MYVSSKESLRKKVAAEEPLTRGELKVVGKLLDRLEKVEKLINTIKWCDENDEPVSGYIMDALVALEKDNK